MRNRKKFIECYQVIMYKKDGSRDISYYKSKKDAENVKECFEKAAAIDYIKVHPAFVENGTEVW